jgi:hypothetical protein
LGRGCRIGLAAGIALASAAAASAQHFPDITQSPLAVALVRVATGLGGEIGGEAQVAPTDVEPFPDQSGRLAVATLGGVVRVVANGALLPVPLVTRAQSGVTVPESGEWGMTAIAFDAGFAAPASPGYGTFYTINPVDGNGGGVVPDFGATGAQDHQDVVTAWTLADPARNAWDAALGDTRRELFRVGKVGEVHNVVDLAVGTDEMLYVSSGDGGAGADVAQDPRGVLGAILRIDPHGTNAANGKYGIPPDNPFVGGGTVLHYTTANPAGTPIDPLDEVFAYGFRSPYRMTFDRATGDLWVGDVGQSDVEEVNRVEPARNYGWNIKEGSLKSGQNLGSSRVEPDTPENNPYSDTESLAEQFDLVDPVFEYDHDEGVVVVGGFVYRGSRADLAGRYVFGDLGETQPSARLLEGDVATGAIRELAIEPGGPVFANGQPLPARLLAIGEDPDGELLLAVVGNDPREGGGAEGELVAVAAPEPGAPALLAAGAGVLAAARRRRR